MEIWIILDIVIAIICMLFLYLMKEKNIKLWVCLFIVSLVPLINLFFMMVLIILFEFNKPDIPRKWLWKKEKKVKKVKRILSLRTGELMEINYKYFNVLRDNKMIKWCPEYKFYCTNKNRMLIWSDEHNNYILKKIK